MPIFQGRLLCREVYKPVMMGLVSPRDAVVMAQHDVQADGTRRLMCWLPDFSQRDFQSRERKLRKFFDL